jgi:hypothetical protein
MTPRSGDRFSDETIRPRKFMRGYRSALLCLAAVAALASVGDAAFAQRVFSRAPAPGAAAPSRGGFNGGGFRGPGFGVVVPGVLGMIPRGGQYVDYGNDVPQGPNRPQRSARRSSRGAPAANERRFVPDEVLIAIPNSVTSRQIDALQTRFRLTRLESQTFQLPGLTLYRWRVPNGISVPRAVRALESDARVTSVQPNYLYTIQQSEPAAASEGDAAQYELAKLHLPQAHRLAKGDKVLVAVLDSGVDANHPELVGAIAGTYDTLSQPFTPHKHGTAIAGLIAAHGRLMGAAPDAHILAIRAFNPTDKGADGTTFNVLKGLDWAAANGARVVNMSFAGPADPALHRSLEAAHKKGIVLVAAAGNAGPKSPPLYPAADPNVIAVTATDTSDKLFAQANRGNHIALAAPGTQILVANPDGAYEASSGTSYSAAEVSGIVALMLDRKSDLTPDKVRAILMATAKDLGPKGRDPMFGAGLADAYGALMAEEAPRTTPPPPERVSAGAR